MKIGGMVEQPGLTLYSILSLPDRPGTVARILKIFSEHKVNLHYITEGSSQDGTAILSFCIDKDEDDHIDEVLKHAVEQTDIQIKKQEFVGIVGIYGPHFREKPSIAAKLFNALGQESINILSISSSISTISCIISIQEFDKARKAILKEFELP